MRSEIEQIKSHGWHYRGYGVWVNSNNGKAGSLAKVYQIEFGRTIGNVYNIVKKPPLHI